MTGKGNIRGLQHIGLPVADFEKSVAFYEALGFDNVYQTEHEGNPVAFLRIGGLTLEVYPYVGCARKAGVIDHIALDVADVDGMYQTALERGYDIVPPGLRALPFWDNGIRFFNIVGPDGETVEFSQIL